MVELPQAHRIKSSILYFFILQINMFWNIVNTIVLIVLQSMKVHQYPASKVDREFSIVAPFLLFFLSYVKISLAKPGNRSENFILIIISLVLMVPCIIMDVYFLVWQPYCWSWESPFHYVSIGIEVIFFFFSIIMAIVFLLKK